MAWRKVREAANELGISTSYIRQLIARGRLTTRKRDMPAWPFYYREINEASFRKLRAKLDKCSKKTKATRTG